MAGVLGFDEALAVVLREASGVRGARPERMELLAARGRVLAEPVEADRDQPGFDRATRDGFAIRAADLGVSLRIVGQVRAGERWTGAALGPGEAVEIMTGAPVPEGADAVVMIEHVTVEGEVLEVGAGRVLRAGENVVPRGAEARAGDVVLPERVVMGAAEIALAAACGRAQISVYRRPRVAIVATGDELVEVEVQPEAWQIRNSNSYGLAALVEETGAEAVRLPIARDSLGELRAALTEARTCDLMVLSGGVSMGKYDLVEEVLAEMGAKFFFTGVRMQPGKPVVFGRLPETGSGEGTGRYFFGLPGNPVSTEVTFHCFAGPLLRVLAGAAWEEPRFVLAKLGEDVDPKAGLTRVLPARLTGTSAEVDVRVVRWQGSGDLRANARANCYVVLPEREEGFRAGEVVTVLLR